MVAPITPISKTPPPGTGSISLAPGWAETSVRWLQRHHPEYLARVSKGETFMRRLERSLIKASYLYKEGMSHKDHQKLVSVMVSGWGEPSHERLVEWFAAGGYSGTKEFVIASARAAGKSSALAGKKPSGMVVDEVVWPGLASERVVVRDKDGAIIESISIEEDDGEEPTEDKRGTPVPPDVIDAVESKLRPKSEISQKRELQEIVELELLKNDDRYGVW